MVLFLVFAQINEEVFFLACVGLQLLSLSKPYHVTVVKDATFHSDESIGRCLRQKQIDHYTSPL